MRNCSRFLISGLTALLVIAAAVLYSIPAYAANLPGGQITYMATNTTTGKTDIYLADSTGDNTVNITESLPVGNINGFSWSPEGAFLAFSDNKNIVYRLEMNTRELETLAENGYDPAWSPLGDTIVYTSISDGNREIYTLGDVNLTHSKSEEYHPVWTREGKIIFFSNWENLGRNYLYFMDANGQNVHNYESTDGLPAANQVSFTLGYPATQEIPESIFTMSWSPEYQKAVFARQTSGWGEPLRGEIVIQDLQSGDETRVFEADGQNIHPLWSPDGKKIAFLSDRDSYFELGNKVTVVNLYVMNTDGSNPVRLTNYVTGFPIQKTAWRPLTEETAVTETAVDHPAALSLGPVFPNPFNPSATISFTLPASGKARLAVYSVTGQMVRELAGGNLPSGEHRVVWDGRDGNGRAVSSGVYISRLESKGRTATAKITLLR